MAVPAFHLVGVHKQTHEMWDGKIGGGRNVYDRLLPIGDDNADGKVDLPARKTTGELLRYSGTGNAARPFTAPVQIAGNHMKEFNLL